MAKKVVEIVEEVIDKKEVAVEVVSDKSYDEREFTK